MKSLNKTYNLLGVILSFLVLLQAVSARTFEGELVEGAQPGKIVGWGSQVVGVDLSEGFVAIAVGAVHSLGLKQDGSIVAWGYNWYGQCDVPLPNSGFVAVAAGMLHSLGLKVDGSIAAWGDNRHGQCDVPSPNAGFVAIAAGGNHSLGLKEDGSIVAWGDNEDGQCDVPSPNSGFVAVAAGDYHSLGVKKDGSIAGWGWDEHGQCDAPSPNSGFVAIAAGGGHNLGLKVDGSIVAWGANTDWPDIYTGQCDVPSPNSGFVAVAAGMLHSLGLKVDGSIVAWGDNQFGQCDVPSPNTGFTAIATGAGHSLALKADGSIAAWGNNEYGQCNVPSPNASFAAVAAGAHHDLGLKEDGSIVAWGDNEDGQCDVPSPNSGFVAVAAGYGHSLGLKEDGSIVAWGDNEDGQCDDPSPNAGFVAVAAGEHHSLGLKADGSIVAWGNNEVGQCNPPPGGPNTGFVAVAAGGGHNLGLKADGSIVAWGYNWHGQCNVPPPNTGFVMLAAGRYHSVGLKADGSIVAWGNNEYGQCDVPSPNTGFVTVAAGYSQCLGLKAHGSIVAWGNNECSQCDVPSPNTGFVAVAGGGRHSLAIRGDFPFDVEFIVVNRRRVGRTTFEYECQVQVKSYAAFPLENVELTLVGVPESLDEIIDPTATLPYIESNGSAVSEDTCIFQVDRLEKLDPKEMIWESRCVTADLIIDDFEHYNDYCHRIFYTWVDGWGYTSDAACGVAPYGGNGTGSTVGYLAAPYAERTIVHEGKQSMPLEYVNDGSTGKALYSETGRTFDPPQDWTRQGVKALTLWFQGRAPSVGSFSYDPATQIYTLTAGGTDIYGTSDQFHFACKQLSGLGSIQVNVRSLTNTHEWTKGGLMIRQTLDADSVYASALITPLHGVRFQVRMSTGGDTTTTFVDGVTAPQWLRLERGGGDTYTVSYSPDGSAGSWTQVGDPVSMAMNANVYIGFALTSHDASAMATAEFSDITTTGTVTAQWQSQDIGIASNEAEQLYVAIEDSTGKTEVVEHPDPNAVLLNTWQEWNIDLKQVSDAGVNLASISKMYIGLGDRDAPEFGGDGTLYIDDIRLYKP